MAFVKISFFFFGKQFFHKAFYSVFPPNAPIFASSEAKGIGKIFNDFDKNVEDYLDEEKSKKLQSKQDFLLPQLVRNEKTLNQIRLVLWLIFAVLCIYAFHFVS